MRRADAHGRHESMSARRNFENRRQPLLPRRQFYHRLARSALVSAVIVAAALSIGIVGYHFAAGVASIDALLHAALIFTGIGAVDRLGGRGAKSFAAGR